MNVRITVPALPLRVIDYKDKHGEPAKLYTQTVYVHTVDREGKALPFPEKAEILMPKGRTTPIPAGEFTLHPSAIQVGRDGRIEVLPDRLVPHPQGSAGSAAR